MFDDLADPTLESELCSQAAHVTAGECRLVLLIAEFDRRGTWSAAGARSCAHWLNWRVGTGMTAAREQVRVGRRLTELPIVRAAFAAGEISYSKVRAITRVASPKLEGPLVELARHATAAQLEQIVREYRRADPEEAKLAQARHAARYLRTFTDSEGMVVINARLSPEDGAIVIAAIEAARESMEAAGPPERDASAETSEPDGEHASEADALVAVCASVLSTGLVDAIAAPRVSVIVHVDEQVLDDATAAGCAHIDGVGAITGHAARRLACDGAVSKILYARDGSVEPEGATRTVAGSMRRALLARDRGCRWPGCNARRHLHAHHVVWCSRGGRTVLSNLVTLCGAHHRFLHEGGYELELERSGALRVWSPAGVEVSAVARPPAVGPGGLAGLHRRQGLQIDATTLAVDGEGYDLACTIDALLYGYDDCVAS